MRSVRMVLFLFMVCMTAFFARCTWCFRLTGATSAVQALFPLVFLSLCTLAAATGTLLVGLEKHL